MKLVSGGFGLRLTRSRLPPRKRLPIALVSVVAAAA